MKLRLTACAVWLAGPACMGLHGATASPSAHAVTIGEFRFAPQELAVSVGDTVVWTNTDALLHTTSADSGAWSSPEMRQGERFTFIAPRAGRFAYHCAAHPVMQATLAVRP
jgi:plastocyanin